MRVAIIAVALAYAASASAEQPMGPQIREIHRSSTRAADGKKYPVPVEESYTIGDDRVLHYFAYFGNMPINMNHNDRVDWDSAEHGANVLEHAQQLFADPKSGIRKLHDGEQAAPDAFVFTIRRNGADSTWVLDNVHGEARTSFDVVWRRLVEHFEKATGRPKKPSELPQ